MEPNDNRYLSAMVKLCNNSYFLQSNAKFRLYRSNFNGFNFLKLDWDVPSLHGNSGGLPSSNLNHRLAYTHKQDQQTSCPYLAIINIFQSLHSRPAITDKLYEREDSHLFWANWHTAQGQATVIAATSTSTRDYRHRSRRNNQVQLIKSVDNKHVNIWTPSGLISSSWEVKRCAAFRPDVTRDRTKRRMWQTIRLSLLLQNHYLHGKMEVDAGKVLHRHRYYSVT